MPSSQDNNYLYLNNLVKAFQNDADRAALPRDSLLKVLLLRRDLISHHTLSTSVKPNSLTVFFQYANFIGGKEIPGSMAQVNKENRAFGFLSFLRFVGSVYFKKHLVPFTTVCNIETPHQLYNSIDSASTPEERHKFFIQKIRSINSERITSEEERMPSLSSLWRHWLRTAYVCTLWQSSHLADPYSNLTLPEDSGWMFQEGGSYTIDWDDPD